MSDPHSKWVAQCQEVIAHMVKRQTEPRPVDQRPDMMWIHYDGIQSLLDMAGITTPIEEYLKEHGEHQGGGAWMVYVKPRSER